jgi:AcrR family transcriptional regulator
MPRPTKEQIDDEILEAAAILFARHGFKETSVQRIADAVGYSKTGLLHRYPSKETLQQAVVDRALQAAREISDEVAAVPPGAERDRAGIIRIARLALENPGMVALILSGLTTDRDAEIGQALHEIGRAVFEIFAVGPESDPRRLIRVIGALGGLAVAAISVRDKVPAEALSELADVGFDALGHGRTPSHANH